MACQARPDGGTADRHEIRDRWLDGRAVPAGTDRAALLPVAVGIARAAVSANARGSVRQMAVSLDKEKDAVRRDPARVAAVALDHAGFGAVRPQGRALVRVRAQRDRPGADGLERCPTLIDIVTDDMPFLVDSATMEINRHGLGIRVL